MNLISLRCQDCGATMILDYDKKIVGCPHCGSNLLIVETDEVKIAELQAKVATHRIDQETEKIKDTNRSAIEIEKLRLAQRQSDNNQGIRKIWVRFIIFMILLSLYCLMIYTGSH